MFSKACELGIKAMIYLASCREKGTLVSLKEIHEKINSPEAFTAKILQQLVRHRLLYSVRGPNGGFRLLLAPDEITLQQIVIAIDGDGIFTKCALGLKVCSAAVPCPLHYKFLPIRDSLAKMLHSTTLAEVSAGELLFQDIF